MKYHLSSRQNKELTNGKTLCIALPVEHLPSSSADAFIRDLIELPRDVAIIRPIESVIRVDPWTRPSGLSQVLGTIIQDDDRHPQFELSVNVISFHLSARRETRGNYPTQWPGSMTLDDGSTLP